MLGLQPTFIADMIAGNYDGDGTLFSQCKRYIFEKIDRHTTLLNALGSLDGSEGGSGNNGGETIVEPVDRVKKLNNDWVDVKCKQLTGAMLDLDSFLTKGPAVYMIGFIRSHWLDADVIRSIWSQRD